MEILGIVAVFLLFAWIGSAISTIFGLPAIVSALITLVLLCVLFFVAIALEK